MLDLLKGTRVVSFNHFLMGPMGIQALGDLGADVIAVEPAEGAWQRHWFPANKNTDGMSTLYLCANRNKCNIALNLKSPKAKDIALNGFMSTTSTMIIDRCVTQGIDETPVSAGYDRVRFLGPVYFGDTVTVTYTIIEIDAVKRRTNSEIEVRNQNGDLVAVGAHVLRWVPNPKAAA